MAFTKGQSGNPGGQPLEKPFISALRRAIAQEDGKRLRDAAEKLLDLAAAGEAWAIQMLADRTDGKPTQAVEQKTEMVAEVTHNVAPELSKEEWLKHFGK